MGYCKLEQLCILSNTVALYDSLMVALSAHGGMVDVIINALFVTQTGIETIIKNSPNLITCHIYSTSLYISKEFRMMLTRKYGHRKLFLCGSYCFVEGNPNKFHIGDTIFLRNMDFVSLWSCSY